MLIIFLIRKRHTLTNVYTFAGIWSTEGHASLQKLKKNKMRIAWQRDPSQQQTLNESNASAKNSGTGNRTPGVCVTGRNVTNYTNEDKSLETQKAQVSLRCFFLLIDKKVIHSRFLRVILDPGAMLIFSVSFQFLRMMPKHSEINRMHLRKPALRGKQ